MKSGLWCASLCHAKPKTMVHFIYFCGTVYEDKNLKVSSAKTKFVLQCHWRWRSRKGASKGFWLEGTKSFPEWAVEEAMEHSMLIPLKPSIWPSLSTVSPVLPENKQIISYPLLSQTLLTLSSGQELLPLPSNLYLIYFP